MISTIRTVTMMVSSMTSSMVSAMGIAGSLGVVAVVTLIGVLIVKELVSTQQHLSKLASGLSIAILPLMMVFVGIVLVKIMEVL